MRLFAAQILLLLAGVVLAAEAPWPRPAPAWRRALQVELYTGPARTISTTVFLPLPDGEPTAALPVVHLRDAAGKPRPHGELQRLGSRLTLYFDGASGEQLYLYPGALTPALPPPPLRSGLLQQVRPFDDRPVNTVAEFEQLWAAAPPLAGQFVGQIFAAYNPFGANAGHLHRYDGWLAITTPGEYTFCLATTDAGFLLIDGHPAVAWPGKHPAAGGLKGQIRGQLTLTAGAHRLAFLHANSTAAGSYALAAWIPPGETTHSIIPATAFTEAAYAQVGRLTRADCQPSAEFTWEAPFMVRVGERALYQQSLAAGPEPPGDGWAAHWDFGDGTQGHGAQVEHAYFATGDYPVTLEWRRLKERHRGRQLLALRAPIGQNENDDRRAIGALRRAIAQEPKQGVAPPGYATLIELAASYLQDDLVAQFAPRVLAQVAVLPPADLSPLLFRLALDLQLNGERYELAEQAFQALRERAAAASERQRATLHYAGLLLHCLNRPTDARALLATLKTGDFDTPVEQRLLGVYLADTALLLDGLAAASDAYAMLAPPPPPTPDGKADRRALARERGRYLEIQNQVAQKHYPEALEALNLLEWDNPGERLRGAFNLLKAEALAGAGQPRKAAVTLERALLATLDDRERPTLRLSLARLLATLDQPARALGQIRELLKESPYAREAVDAAELQRTLETALRNAPK